MTDPLDPRERPPPVPIPHTAVSAEALRGIIESFVLREGTDYGARELSLEEKRARLRRQLERGEVVIAWDERLGTGSLVPREPTRRG